MTDDKPKPRGFSTLREAMQAIVRHESVVRARKFRTPRWRLSLPGNVQRRQPRFFKGPVKRT